MKKKAPQHGLRTDKKAVSPAISSVIVTSATVSLLLVTIVFANNFLNARIAESDFNAMKQFMQTIGLQVDDVAWTAGRTQTFRYASRFGQVDYQSSTLTYSVYVNKGAGYVFVANFTTGIILYDVSVSKYSIRNGYHEHIFPFLDHSFLQRGVSAPINHVFVVEKIPMSDGNYTRVVTAPSIRVLNATIFADGIMKNYFKYYLPMLSGGSYPRQSQSVTLEGIEVSVKTESDVDRIKILLSLPKASGGFDQVFFPFGNVQEEMILPPDSTIQFYTGKVSVSLGLHS